MDKLIWVFTVQGRWQIVGEPFADVNVVDRSGGGVYIYKCVYVMDNKHRCIVLMAC